jgi:Protein of unknown function (DUF1449)
VNEFLHTALSFPTAVYGVLLTVCAVYWLLAATGLTDGDAMDGLFGGEGDAGSAEGAAAMLGWLGLGGVPLMVVATTFSLLAWLGTYFVQLLVLEPLPGAVRGPAGIGALLGCGAAALAAASIVLRPVGRALARHRAAVEPSLLGRSGVVITPTLTADYGQAAFDDGGAGLILQVRHDDSTPLQRGDRIVLIEYLDGQNAYRVVSEQQFLGR